MWILAIALSLPLQDAAPSPVQSDSPVELVPTEWLPLNGVVAQAGDAVVLASDLDKTANWLVGTQGVTLDALPPGKRDEVYGVSIYREMLEELAVQAGEDLGISMNDVDRLVRAAQRDERLRQGVGSFSDNLRDRGLDAVDWELGQRSGLFQRSWEQEMLGKRGFASERPHREEFMRPGKLFAIYRSEAPSLGTPSQVQFQDLNVPISTQGAEHTLDQMMQLRDALIEGSEDFDMMASEWNPEELADRKGVSALLVPERLTDPIAKEFGMNAEVGEISEPIPLMVPDPKTGAEVVGFYKLRRLLQRIEGTLPPPFSDPTMQTRLRERVIEVDTEVLLHGSRARLFKTSYRWLQEGVTPPLAPQPPL